MQSSNNQFSIGLPDGEEADNIPKLIRWALKEIRQEQLKGSLSITEFYLDHPYTTEDKPNIIANFEFVERPDIGSTAQYSAKGMSETRVETSYAIPVERQSLLNQLTVRMPIGEGQDNGLALLYGSADIVEGWKGRYKVIDLIYHDFLDDNDIGRPYVHVFFAPA